MEKLYFSPYSFTLILLFVGFSLAHGQNSGSERSGKTKTMIYFNPEIFPDIEEIKEPTYSAFFSAVSDQLSNDRNFRSLRVDANIPYDEVDAKTIREFCSNNNAQLAVIPKVKYFKVGIGKYVFSNQVIISMKLFDASGNFITEAAYDTFKKNARLLGSAENSIKIGTKGALKGISKNLRKGLSTGISLVEY